MIHKETSPLGDTIIYMNGRPLYKKWPNGSSMVFEKYGIPTSNADRDRGHYGALGSKAMEGRAIHNEGEGVPTQALAMMFVDLCDELIVDRDLRDRAVALFTGVWDALEWLQRQKNVDLDIFVIREHFKLEKVISLADSALYPEMPTDIRASIRAYLESLPEFDGQLADQQPQVTVDNHAILEIEFTKRLAALVSIEGHPR